MSLLVPCPCPNDCSDLMCGSSLRQMYGNPVEPEFDFDAEAEETPKAKQRKFDPDNKPFKSKNRGNELT